MAEEQLIKRIHQGDRRAQRELYDAYAGMAMATAMRYVADRDAACDVLQESFCKIFTTIGRFEYRGEGSLKGWVMRVVSNEAIDWLKRRHRLQPMTLDDVPELDSMTDEAPDVGSVTMETLQQMIEQLPDGYRTVFCLYVLDRLSHREIARLLDIKENTSASQLLRAKRMLARMINDYKRHQI
ncbi:MAG: sigma-70 family RNA polymerase sigma factor [Prevotella sp.]|nr:sigma-70 family RNA polymerase sigma factor [Prevotella sp.]